MEFSITWHLCCDSLSHPENQIISPGGKISEDNYLDDKKTDAKNLNSWTEKILTLTCSYFLIAYACLRLENMSYLERTLNSSQERTLGESTIN